MPFSDREQVRPCHQHSPLQPQRLRTWCTCDACASSDQSLYNSFMIPMPWPSTRRTDAMRCAILQVRLQACTKRKDYGDTQKALCAGTGPLVWMELASAGALSQWQPPQSSLTAAPQPFFWVLKTARLSTRYAPQPRPNLHMSWCHGWPCLRSPRRQAN